MVFLKILTIHLNTSFDLLLSPSICLTYLITNVNDVFFFEEEIMLKNLFIFVTLCGCGEIGRHARFRI